MKKLLSITAIAASIMLAGCFQTDAEKVSANITKAADSFEVMRSIVFYNGITNDYVAEVQGLCSVTATAAQFYVVCKEGPNEYKRHNLGLSDNVTWFSIQLDSVDASTYRTRIIFKPQNLLFDIDFQPPTE